MIKAKCVLVEFVAVIMHENVLGSGLRATG